MKPERECSPIQAVMEPLKGLSLGGSSAMEDVVTSGDHHSNVTHIPTAGVDSGQYQQRPHDLETYQQQTPNLEQYHQQQIHDSGQYDQQSNSSNNNNNNNDITIDFNKHYSTSPYHQQQGSMSAGWSYVPQSPFNVINNNGCDDSINDPQQEDIIDQQQQNLSQYQEGMSQHQQNLSQFQEGMSQLQQDMSQARMVAECPLQSVYLERLQELVPWVPKDEQLPKLQLVQAVIDYINMLQDQLEGGEGGSAVNADVRCQGFGVAGGYCQEALTVDARIECSDVNSCHDSSEASSPSPPPSPPRVVGGGGAGGQEPSPPHLFTHLQEKHMVNELSQLQMVTALSMNDTPSPVGAREEALDVDTPYRHYHIHHHHHHHHHQQHQQQIVDGFSNEHQQIMSDLRHLRMKDPVSAAAATQRQMVGEMGEDRAAATNGISHTNGISDINGGISDIDGGINGCTNHSGVPHQQYTGTHQQRYSAHHQTTYSAAQRQQDQLNSAQYPQPHPASIFPFPAPPSPQTIKAARKKKMLLKKQQQQQQQQQDFGNSECYPLSMQ